MKAVLNPEKKSGQAETYGGRCLHYGVLDGGVWGIL